MKKIEAFETVDGELFRDEQAARSHETEKTQGELLEQFSMYSESHLEYTPRGRASAKRIVSDFLIWMQGNKFSLPWDENLGDA